MLDRLYAVLAVAATFGVLIFRPARRNVHRACAYAIGSGSAVVAMWLASVNLAHATQALFPC